MLAAQQVYTLHTGTGAPLRCGGCLVMQRPAHAHAPGFQGSRAAGSAGAEVVLSCRKEEGRVHPLPPPSSQISREDEGEPVPGSRPRAGPAVPHASPDTCRPAAASEELGREPRAQGSPHCVSWTPSLSMSLAPSKANAWSVLPWATPVSLLPPAVLQAETLRVLEAVCDPQESRPPLPAQTMACLCLLPPT